jgi:ribosomal protein S27AE
VSDQLIVMRLADMWRTRPDQDNSRVCSKCGEQVGIYPSGQAVLRERPQTAIVCNVCYEPTSGVNIPAPGALEEAREPPSYVCPRCGARSFNPNDIRERYCGRCHVFQEDEPHAICLACGQPHEIGRIRCLRCGEPLVFPMGRVS